MTEERWQDREEAAERELDRRSSRHDRYYEFWCGAAEFPHHGEPAVAPTSTTEVQARSNLGRSMGPVSAGPASLCDEDSKS